MNDAYNENLYYSMNARSAYVFLVVLAEKLSLNYRNECRFDVYYLFKKALVGINGLLEDICKK